MRRSSVRVRSPAYIPRLNKGGEFFYHGDYKQLAERNGSGTAGIGSGPITSFESLVARRSGRNSPAFKSSARGELLQSGKRGRPAIEGVP